MSTRCQIGIYESKGKKRKDFEVLLYKHCDGYPEGVLPVILPFLKWWRKERGISDSEHTGARLLQWLCNQSDGELIKENPKWVNKDFTGVLGYGICKVFHDDIEFFYKIYPNAVKVYAVRSYWSKGKEANFRLLKTIEI